VGTLGKGGNEDTNAIYPMGCLYNNQKASEWNITPHLAYKIDYFRNLSFTVIGCTGTDNQTDNDQEIIHRGIRTYSKTNKWVQLKKRKTGRYAETYTNKPFFTCSNCLYRTDKF